MKLAQAGMSERVQRESKRNQGGRNFFSQLSVTIENTLRRMENNLSFRLALLRSNGLRARSERDRCDRPPRRDNFMDYYLNDKRQILPLLVNQFNYF